MTFGWVCRSVRTWQGSHGSWRPVSLITLRSGAIAGRGNDRVKVKPLLARVGSWRDFLLGEVSEEEIQRIRRHERTGRPLGDEGFVGRLEEALGRILQRPKPGRKKEHKHRYGGCHHKGGRGSGAKAWTYAYSLLYRNNFLSVPSMWP